MTSATVVKSKEESETRRGLRVAVTRLCEPELDLTIPVGSIVVDSNTVIGGSLVDLLARVTKRPRICRKNRQKHICPYKANGHDVHILRPGLQRI